MNDVKQAPSMHQKIFELGFPMETTSLYLLCCGLADAGSTLSIKNLLNVWNASPEALEAGLHELESHGILVKIISDGEKYQIYKLSDIENWK